MVGLLAMIAFAVDVGYMATIRTQMQSTADSAAMAGAGALINGTVAAQAEALAYVQLNKVGGQPINAANVTTEFGNWDITTRTFAVTNNKPNAIRISLVNSSQSLFFGKVLGKNSFDTSVKAVATYQPRDVAMVLDYSGSMCYDSQLKNVGLLGQLAIEANMLQIYSQLGSPICGTLTWLPVQYGNTKTSVNNVKKFFLLNKTPYPFPGGSWNEYIDYVQTDSDIKAAGYQCKYVYLTWINYLLSEQPGADETPGLHAVNEQPVTALKDAVDVFLSYLQSNSTNDRVALSLYTYSDNKAVLEQGLTTNYATISSICRARQAGHYVGGTNISAGMNKGRLEVQNNARLGAKKMMVLMTDGVVNLPSGNTTSDKAAVISEANACAAANIAVVTIALGAYADTALMQQVASITGGAAFVVPGGQPIAQVKAQLEAVFGQVASDRPLKLVQ